MLKRQLDHFHQLLAIGSTKLPMSRSCIRYIEQHLVFLEQLVGGNHRNLLHLRNFLHRLRVDGEERRLRNDGTTDQSTPRPQPKMRKQRRNVFAGRISLLNERHQRRLLVLPVMP